MSTVETFATGLHLPECPRWHDGALHISDMWDRAVRRFDAAGGRQRVWTAPEGEDPGGLGWMPDGDLLVVGMEGRRVYRVSGRERSAVHADLAPFAAGQCNDMVVRSDGTAYVSHFGYDFWAGPAGFRPASLLRVTPHGDVTVAADDLLAPNGMAWSADEGTLYLAECGRSQLVAFDVAEFGELSHRRVHATIAPAVGQSVAPPDGICLDEDGGIWAAEPVGRRVLRIDADGAVTDEIGFADIPLAVELGGDDRRQLFVCVTDQIHKADRHPTAGGRIDVLQVAVAGARRPESTS